ncbi:cytochrome P450 [Bradyrhizobium sp. RDT10]
MNETITAIRAPVVDVDPFSLAYLNDPHPYHARLREAGPVFRFKDYDAWGVARHREVASCMQDWETFISGAGVGLADLRKVSNIVIDTRLTLEIDPPEHGKYRSVFTRILNPGLARNLREEFTRKADDLAEELVERGTFDAAKDLAAAFPQKVFPDAIGLRPDGRENLWTWSDAVFNSWGPDNELQRESARRGLEAREWIRESCSRDMLSPDGMGMKIYEAADRGDVEPDDAPFLVRPFLTAGLDTTMAGLGAAMLGLVTHPDQWALLHESPGLARQAFEEAVRWESPVQAFFRTTSRPITIGEVTLPADAKVLMLMGAANRDPAHWTHPERYDIMRKTTGHLGFGLGIHACVGQMIARLEGEVLLNALAKRIASIEMIGTPKFKPNNTTRALASMPVRVVPA